MNPRLPLLVSAALLGACATQGPPAPATVVAGAPPGCLRDTGTRLELPEGRCALGYGRVITREELESTGAIELGGALRQLVPF